MTSRPDESVRRSSREVRLTEAGQVLPDHPMAMRISSRQQPTRKEL
jgi:hypothetical protein